MENNTQVSISAPQKFQKDLDNDLKSSALTLFIENHLLKKEEGYSGLSKEQIAFGDLLGILTQKEVDFFIDEIRLIARALDFDLFDDDFEKITGRSLIGEEEIEKASAETAWEEYISEKEGEVSCLTM